MPPASPTLSLYYTQGVKDGPGSHHTNIIWIHVECELLFGSSSIGSGEGMRARGRILWPAKQCIVWQIHTNLPTFSEAPSSWYPCGDSHMVWLQLSTGPTSPLSCSCGVQALSMLMRRVGRHGC